VPTPSLTDLARLSSLTGLTKRDPYHHGALRRALVDAGVELAREGGPSAIVLREVARRIGVSPNAAYRHFAALPELMDAIADAALGALARSMEAELAGSTGSGSARADAVGQLLAVGRGYVHFALAEPGLFAAAFSRPREDIGSGGGTGASGLSAGDLLQRALDGLVAAGLLADEDRAAAVTTAWAAVHGLSALMLGPLAGVAPEAREPLIDASLDLVCRGLLRR
jgi:AcrR family transcriptional regulator